MRLSRKRFRGQSLVEFALVAPIMLLVIFAIIELARLLHAWVTIENGSRFGVRYAVTGEFEDTYCSGYAGGVCDEHVEREAARIPSIHDAARSGAAGIWVDPTASDGTAGFLKVTVCSNKSGYVFFPSNSSTVTSADCQPHEDAGAPGDRVSVSV
ncbi:MAG: TadE/TadG family type IV pilus assembly protein, partial [Anaerolineales bacterium]